MRWNEREEEVCLRAFIKREKRGEEVYLTGTKTEITFGRKIGIIAKRFMQKA
jgi:hypothetical protein